MSTCISSAGEYSEHEAGDWCSRCDEFNEAAIVAQRDALAQEVERLRAEIAGAWDALDPDLERSTSRDECGPAGEEPTVGEEPQARTLAEVLLSVSEGVRALWEVSEQRRNEVGRLRASADEWWRLYDEQLAEVKRLRAATVKPDRETVARALFLADAGPNVASVAVPAWDNATNEHAVRRYWLDQAAAVLDLLPGRTEAEVKAEALREFAARVRDEVRASDEILGRGWATDECRNGLHSALSQADEAADRLAAEGGAS